MGHVLAPGWILLSSRPAEREHLVSIAQTLSLFFMAARVKGERYQGHHLGLKVARATNDLKM